MPTISELGQRRLGAARVAVMGAGGLGSPVLLYLAAAGVGTIGVIDDDVVDTTNLQRQVIHEEGSVGQAKTESAARAIAAHNSEVEVVTHRVRIDEVSGRDVFANYDLVVDGTDNFPTRYAVNDACAALGKPFVWASVFRNQAQLSVFWKQPRWTPGATPIPGVDLRDLFPTPPDPASVPSCGNAGVLGALTGQVGAMMATEAIKLIVGGGDSLLGRVLFVDAWGATVREMPLRPRRHDPPPSETAEYCEPPALDFVTPEQVVAMLASHTPPVVLDVRSPNEVELAAIAGSVRIPLDELARRVSELPPGVVVVHCKTSPRAELAARLLLAAGREASVMAGGIIAWADQIDQTLTRY